MRKRPEPIDVSRSRSKSPSPMFISRSVLPRIRSSSETKQITQPIRTSETKEVKPNHTSETKQVKPNHTSETKPKIKVVSSSGELVEPLTPPGVPPYLKPKRPVIKNRFNKQI